MGDPEQENLRRMVMRALNKGVIQSVDVSALLVSGFGFGGAAESIDTGERSMTVRIVYNDEDAPRNHVITAREPHRG